MKTEKIFTFIDNCRLDRSFRKKVLLLSLLIGLYIFIIPAYFWKQSLQKDLSVLLAKSREFSMLTGQYGSLRDHVNAIEQKKTLTKTTSVAQAIGEIAQSLGVNEKVKSIKETGIKKTPDQMREETAEIKIEKMNMTEMIHLFYKVENAPMILTMKKVMIKKSFVNPDLLDVTMTISLFTNELIS